jgi:long-chain acyl-CoA synthetase
VAEPLGARVARWARRHPHARAAISGGTVITYAELDRLADAIAAGFGAHGVRRGDVVAYLGRNSVIHPVLMTAASRHGAVFVSLNWRLTCCELDVVLTDCAPRVVVVQEEFTDLLGGRPAGSVVVVAADNPAQLLTWAQEGGHGVTAGADDPPGVPDPDTAIVALSYTSGTTGAAKGVALSAAQLDAYLTREVPWSMRPGDVALIVSPVFHIAGWGWVGIALTHGACALLVPDPQPVRITQAIREHGATLTLMVPTLIQLLLDQPAPTALNSLRMVTYGAASITPELIERLRAAAPLAELAQGYGLSESGGTITALGPEDHGGGSPYLASVGRALPGIAVAVFDLDNDRPVADGVLGEVRTRSDQNCTGYLHRPEATERLYRDGWLCTGDLGRIAGGYVYLVDRVDDVINSGGEKVAPAELERVIAQIPGVAEVCVLGTADRHWGQAVTAVVVRTPDATIEAGDVIAACRAELARYKCPRRIEWARSLPRTPSGKISRRQVREAIDG